MASKIHDDANIYKEYKNILGVKICNAMQIAFGFRRRPWWSNSMSFLFNHLGFVSLCLLYMNAPSNVQSRSYSNESCNSCSEPLCDGRCPIGSSKYLICTWSCQNRHKRLGVRGDHFQSLRICIILTPPQCLSGTKEKKLQAALSY